MASPPSPSSAYWRRNTRLILRLLGIWLLLTAAPALFTGWLLPFSFIGWPLPFWLGAYGAPLAYLAIVGFYAWVMNRADARAAASAAAATAAASKPARER